MTKFPVWIDCDPGVDDSCALVLASRLECLDIRGISAVAGNVPLEKTFRNARAVAKLAGIAAPVYPGAKRPLRTEPHTAEYFHGENGLGGCEIPDSDTPEETAPAWDALYAEAVRQKGELTLLALGPMTNVAVALAAHPDLPKYLKRMILILGGSEHGNITPAAEFNAYADPDAAAMTLKCGAEIVMLGLDVLMQAYAYPADLARVFGADNACARFLREAHQFSLKASARYGRDSLALCDSCAVMYAAFPEMFEGVRCGVAVETRGKYTLGKTVVDAVTDHKLGFENALFVTKIYREAYLRRLEALMAK